MQLPEKFTQNTRILLGNEYESFVNSLGETVPVSIRLNNKTTEITINEQVEWCDSGYYLAERPLFTADPLLHAGAYYVQEASSMFLCNAVKQLFPDARRVLDLCAAPGGKSTLLAQYLHHDCLLVCNETVRQRSAILAENLTKWGNHNVIVTCDEPKNFAALGSFFDAVIIDAPCSGEGMFRKDAGAIAQWSEANVKMCAERQRRIIEDAWESLNADGVLIYSTCTFNRHENEENVQWICDNFDAEKLNIDISKFPNISESDYGYRFYPHKTRGEGFFIAAVRKTKSETFKRQKKNEVKKGTKFVVQKEIIEKLDNSREWQILNKDNTFLAYDTQFINDISIVENRIKCIQTALPVAEIKGKDIIPTQNLAFSKVLNINGINKFDINYDTAISYLKKETIYLQNNQLGYILLTFKNVPLGWVKNIGNRCNNLYPAAWRIRMSL
ncbi:MAG: rRNA cytosine-C5-methyltransferase [Paludibacter sp.]|jgi:16S rRNA C967 or C1407 C5-methylase (RsmB/RsmF family)/NOL1/NOP2/fmu family ribosome biogenesis protein|nr:rRNA cytosine-C5-methyltransferase [Paludibacter sp.]